MVPVRRGHRARQNPTRRWFSQGGRQPRCFCSPTAYASRSRASNSAVRSAGERRRKAWTWLRGESESMRRNTGLSTRRAQHQVPVYPAALRHGDGERHPHLDCDARRFRLHAHGAARPHALQQRVEQGADLGRPAGEVRLQVVAPARVRLVAVGERAAARRARPQLARGADHAVHDARGGRQGQETCGLWHGERTVAGAGPFRARRTG